MSAAITQVQSIQFLTQNLWLTNTGRPPKRKAERIQDFLFHINKFDILALQEVFLFGDGGWFVNSALNKQIILDHAKKMNFHYIDTPKPSLFCQDSGLLILSRYPIVESHFKRFQNCSLSEWINNKGVLHAKIQLPNDKRLHVITTHLDAHQSSIRQLQIEELKENLKSWLTKEEQENDPVILCGDWNIDSILGEESYVNMMNTLPDFDHIFDNTKQHPITFPLNNACLDHILISRKYVKSISQCNIEELRGFESQQPISDHYGVSVKLNL
ncbi:unnamed protein product [Didymodactylos carnosus]|uniref:sphingomyelin phosphodiesterase n=1 Tax=Didymodactylos carnosus TaxID=1234261 RepID=A0A814LQC9_9BILA|nr:unnamed protein product [Didymodactylos carnosus]CAF1424479.1 unnamed protein product [Didymodactylos carnosus]CAF3836010.1 unnamed protein product [Didymodactylos carnosus]CAF4224002.1 unnamed protein product [Didymodactylos carnosus]